MPKLVTSNEVPNPAVRGPRFFLRDVHSHKNNSEAGDAQACAFLELAPSAGGSERYGVGLDNNIVTASVKALLSGGNRLSLPVATLTAKLAA